jgi:Pectate lyase superfamily protein
MTVPYIFADASQSIPLAELDANFAAVGSTDNIEYNPPFANSTVETVTAKLAQTVSVEDFGAVGDGTTNDTAAIQAAINSLVSGQTLMFSKNYKITAALTITNKSRIRLSGKGRVFFSGAPSGDYIFTMIGTINDLEIDSLTLEGDNNSSYSQGAIGNNSGQIISNTRFHDLIIKNINVGISHNANLGGSYTTGFTYNNYLENISGTVSGSGYGIQAARAYNLHIYGNTINNASRHSIYVGQGQNLACLIENNIIINHRKDVYDASIRAAIDCGRVSGVTIIGNTFRDCYDGQIYMGADTSNNADCGNNLIIGNKFGTPLNAVPCIWLGEQLVPTTNFLYKIDILDNTFEQDCSITSSGVINLLNGNQITIKNNRLRAYSVTSALPTFVFVGDSRYTSSDTHIGDITVSDNVATSDKGSTVSGSQFLYISTQLCTGSSRYTAKNNSCPTWASEYYFQATPTNVNSRLKFYADITYDVGVLTPGQNGTYAFSVIGCKPTSQVTSKMLYSLQTAPVPVYTFGANDTGVNSVFMTVANTNLTTNSDQPSQVFRFFVEDF